MSCVCVCVHIAKNSSSSPHTFVWCHRRYTEGGPAALANFEAGAAGFEARAFRGCGVVTSDPFDVADGEQTNGLHAVVE